MRIYPVCFFWGIFILGCSSLGGNTSATDNKGASSPLSFFQKKTPEKKPDNLTGGSFTPLPSPTGEAILAGQVMDNYYRRPTGAVIQVTEIQNSGTSQKIEITANSQGYFTIAGLKAGKNYQLVARVRDGDRFYTGTALATPPNPRVSIFLNEENPNGKNGNNTPNASLNGPTAAEAESKSPGSSNQNSAVNPEKVARDTFASAPGALLAISPVGEDKGGYPTPPPPLPFPNQPGYKNNLPSTFSGNNPFPPNLGSAAGPVPSCVLVGQKLENFALHDMNGQVWEYKKNKTGRMVLLDFWFSSCGPCLQSIPHLVELQKRYRSFGLEVVGIAYEKGAESEKISNIRPIRARYHMNYNTLLGGVGLEPCPVRTQFDIQSFPSLVLLDEEGNIVWRNRKDEGVDTRQLAELELEIRRGLGIRSR